MEPSGSAACAQIGPAVGDGVEVSVGAELHMLGVTTGALPRSARAGKMQLTISSRSSEECMLKRYLDQKWKTDSGKKMIV